jgi:hypothetical protein
VDDAVEVEVTDSIWQFTKAAPIHPTWDQAYVSNPIMPMMAWDRFSGQVTPDGTRILVTLTYSVCPPFGTPTAVELEGWTQTFVWRG